MLKTIDPLLTGALLRILADMGHGDEVAIVDANFPSASMGRQVVELPGTEATTVMAASCTVSQAPRASRGSMADAVSAKVPSSGAGAASVGAGMWSAKSAPARNSTSRSGSAPTQCR